MPETFFPGGDRSIGPSSGARAFYSFSIWSLANGILESIERKGRGGGIVDAFMKRHAIVVIHKDDVERPALESALEAHKQLKNAAAYLELHIEQGPILEALKTPIGVVTAIAAPTRFKVIVTGQADHSGTTPMEMRKDALVASAELVVALERICRQYSSMEKGRVVGTVGAMKIEPGVSGYVPVSSKITWASRVT